MLQDGSGSICPVHSLVARWWFQSILSSCSTFIVPVGFAPGTQMGTHRFFYILGNGTGEVFGTGRPGVRRASTPRPSPEESGAVTE